MISLNLLQADMQPLVTRMPVAEFGGRTGTQDGHLYEIVLDEHTTLVLDELQTVMLVESLLDAIPPQFRDLDGEEGTPV